MRKRNLSPLLILLAVASSAWAHVGYTGRDFGTLNGTEKTISNQTVSSAFGWADATDADYGDSHRGRFFRFHLDADAYVRITAQRNTLGTGAQGTFLPAFSLFAGLGQLAPEQGGHDGSQLSINSRPVGTEGSMRALTNWSIGNDATYNTPADSTSGILYASRLAYFTYIGHAADGGPANYGAISGISGDGNADGYVTGTLFVAAGDYSLWVGGANYDAQLTELGPTFPLYGVTVSAVVVPAPVAAKTTSWSRLKALYH